MVGRRRRGRAVDAVRDAGVRPRSRLAPGARVARRRPVQPERPLAGVDARAGGLVGAAVRVRVRGRATAAFRTGHPGRPGWRIAPGGVPGGLAAVLSPGRARPRAGAVLRAAVQHLDRAPVHAHAGDGPALRPGPAGERDAARCRADRRLVGVRLRHLAVRPCPLSRSGGHDRAVARVGLPGDALGGPVRQPRFRRLP